MNIVRPLSSPSELDLFCNFEDAIYRTRAVRWPAFKVFSLSLLNGESAFLRGREIQAFGAFRNGEMLARAAAITDPNYVLYWGDPIGHIAMFEALPGSADESKELLNLACRWLRERGALSARSGFSHFEMPFTIGDDGSLPPIAMRQNPDFYHSLFQTAGFSVERRWVGYRIAVDDFVVKQITDWKNRIQAAGCSVVSLRDLMFPKCLGEFARVLNATFNQHWGRTPLSEDEVLERMTIFESFGALEASAIAFLNDKPVGITFSVRECTKLAVAQSRPIREDERLNLGGETGVLQEARSIGVGRALVAHAYQDFIDHGAKYLYYGPVLDDNWQSRRIGENLGGRLTGTYLVYRRELFDAS
ncbi:MAG: hypothetical protein ACREQR_03935 [Candidatus Binataceae bacterium]